jgi:hypothetical protein
MRTGGAVASVDVAIAAREIKALIPMPIFRPPGDGSTI